jgi:hypothetical protein
MASAAPGATDLNDKLLPIVRSSLFPVVEMRVARDARKSLENYYTTNQYYPYPASFPGDVTTLGNYRGYLPTGPSPNCPGPNPAPVIADLLPYMPGYSAGPPVNPGWFVNNNWQQFMVYAAAPRCTPRIDTNFNITIALLAPPPSCSNGCIPIPPLVPVVQLCLITQGVNTGSNNCNNSDPPNAFLTVGATGNIRAVVMPASYPIAAQARPCAGIADCLEAVGPNTENTDAIDNYVYVNPLRSAVNNDRRLIVAP